jgi:SOS-response transcriptional repressor LexA
MTDRQSRVLEFIRIYWEMKKRSPTLQEIAVGLEMKSRSNIHRIVHSLEKKGLLRIEPRQFRAITVR